MYNYNRQYFENVFSMADSKISAVSTLGLLFDQIMSATQYPENERFEAVKLLYQVYLENHREHVYEE